MDLYPDLKGGTSLLSEGHIELAWVIRISQMLMLLTRLILIFVAALVTSCQSEHIQDYKALVKTEDPESTAHAWWASVKISAFTADPLVENGDAYDTARIVIPQDVTSIYFPNDCRVIEGPDGIATMLLKKSLHWAGHPGVPTSIRKERHKMGCRLQIQNSKMSLSLFGDSASFEGGSSIDMILLLPKTLGKHERKNLRQTDDFSASNKRVSTWFIVPTQPDPRFAFEKYAATASD
jgi:hypothetical protein